MIIMGPAQYKVLYMKSYYMALNLEASEIIACLHNKG